MQSLCSDRPARRSQSSWLVSLNQGESWYSLFYS